MQIDQWIITGDGQQTNFCEFFGSLTQALRDKRMILAQERPNHQSSIKILDISETHTQPLSTAALGIRSEISLARAEVKIGAAQSLHDFAKQEQFFKRRTLCGKARQSITTVFASNVLQAMRDVIKRDVPIDFLPLSALLDHRFGKPLIGSQRLVGETLLVGNPTLVN